MVRAKIPKEDIIRLCFDIFSTVWRKGLKKAVYSIDEKGRIPYPEKYMGLPEGAEELKTTPRRQSLCVREGLAFYKEWPRMEASITFLLRWRGIIVEDNKEWVPQYLKLFNIYIEPGVSFEDLSKVNFDILKSEKTSRVHCVSNSQRTWSRRIQKRNLKSWWLLGKNKNGLGLNRVKVFCLVY